MYRRGQNLSLLSFELLSKHAQFTVEAAIFALETQRFLLSRATPEAREFLRDHDPLYPTDIYSVDSDIIYEQLSDDAKREVTRDCHALFQTGFLTMKALFGGLPVVQEWWKDFLYYRSSIEFPTDPDMYPRMHLYSMSLE